MDAVGTDKREYWNSYVHIHFLSFKIILSIKIELNSAFLKIVSYLEEKKKKLLALLPQNIINQHLFSYENG